MNQSIILSEESNKKIFNEYKIELNIQNDILTISIENNIYNNYESEFNYDFFQKQKLFLGIETIQEVYQFIYTLIEQNNIKIEKNQNSLNLILISTLINHPNVELTINKISILTEKNIERLYKKIEKFEHREEEIEKYIDNEIKIKIELIENKINIKNEELENKIKEQSIKINFLEEKIKNYEFKNKRIQLTKCNLKKIKTINTENEWINSISKFPSGNIISVSYDKEIKIFDKNISLIQNIKNGHNDDIIYVDIKDENNFITCSGDKSIKIWIKKENKFQIYHNIINAHINRINKVIYCSNGNIISCSNDKTIKIWEEKNKKYELITILNNINFVKSILFLEDMNKLVSSGIEGTKIWNINDNHMKNINLIKFFENVKCGWWNGLKRIDNDRVIIGYKFLNIISISKNIILKNINISYVCFGIQNIENKGIFLVGGCEKDIIIFRNDNYECIKIIKNAHNKAINGYVELNDESILSYSNDGFISVWTY
jgi:WD40 repeat protein